VAFLLKSAGKSELRKKNLMKKIVVLSLCSFAMLLAFQTVNAQTVAQWTFENTANTNGLIFCPWC